MIATKKYSLLAYSLFKGYVKYVESYFKSLKMYPKINSLRKFKMLVEH